MVMKNFKLSLLLVAAITVSNRLEAFGFIDADKEHDRNSLKQALESKLLRPCYRQVKALREELEPLNLDDQIALLLFKHGVESVEEAMQIYVIDPI
jgi:hypothetical protein